VAGGENSGQDEGCPKAWEQPMDDEKFNFMRDVIAAPSPVGLEGAMAFGVLKPYLEGLVPKSWGFHGFRGNAGLVLDTDPNPETNKDKLTCMLVGHTDKIRLQVKSVDSAGKVWIDSDSHLPLTLVGNEVTIYSEDKEFPGTYRTIRGGTVEALGAIHFAEANVRSGAKGIKGEQLYVELQIHGDKKQQQVVDGLGLRPGDSILMDRPIKKGVGRNTFQGAYLDNGLGCFVNTQVAELVAKACEKDDTFLQSVRVLFAFASHEEIGRFGSRVIADLLKPDVLIAVDVNHDYVAAPGVSSKKFSELEMGKGPTISVGSVTSPHLNSVMQRAAQRADIPLQIDVVGRDTGTDAMAGVLSCIDCASGSVGIPIRNMHTVSETACTNDVLATTHLLFETLKEFADSPDNRSFEHPNLLDAVPHHID